MADMPKNNANPQMLTLARETRGWTQTQLATATDTVQPVVSRHESGIVPMTPKDVSGYSEALEFEPDLFVQTQPILRLGSTFLFNRKRAQVPVKIQRRIQAEINIQRMQIGRLLNSAERQADYSFPTVAIDEFRGRPESVATYLREFWRVPRGPISNLTELVEHFGGMVIVMDFETTLIDATHIWEPGLPPLFFINSVIPGDRYRFTLAHEVGHAVMHHVKLTDDPETDANRFASQFLMPRKDIQRDLSGLKMQVAIQLKRVWGTSIQSLIRRAKDLNQITQSTYRHMMTALSAGGYRMEEPMPIPHETPTAFTKLIELHRTELRFDDSEMRRLMFADHLGQIPGKERPKMRLVGLYDHLSG